ncbi:MAG: molecular chaperone DnaJ [Armatimonadota bacterium]
MQETMAEKRDYYEVLGVDRTASPDEIKRAYRQAARRLHPDVNRDDPHAEERFKELGAAYSVLSEPQKRAAYDRFGHAGVNGMSGGAGSDDFGFGDLFESFFGGMGRTMQRPDPTGADIGYELPITLEDAFTGTERTFSVIHQGVCAECAGNGTRQGRPVSCPACAGTGQRRQASTNLFGMQFTTVTTCDRCEGTGEIISDPCRICGGTGRVHTTEEIQVKVPAGAETGLRIRFRGKGDAGFRGARAGDLMVVINVLPHKRFQRRGAELLCETPLPFTTAALGGKLTVATLDGEAVVEIPPGTQSGQTFRVRGKGMPDLHGGRYGDLHVVVSIPVPNDLTPRQQELLHELASERGENTDHKSRNIFQKVKDVVGEVVDEYRDRSREAFNE